jgi:chromate reductase, NAD(P)H dehydrogenase (quinone)
MNKKPKILAFAGSLREHSYNKRVLKTAIQGAEKAGAEVTFVDLYDYPMPVYNPDDHERYGYHEKAFEFQKLLTLHEGLLIASPEYNGSLPAALKNVFEWATRQNNTYKKSDVFNAKVAAILSASPGALGGVRALGHLRGVLTSVGITVLPAEVSVSFVNDKFAGDSLEMTDERLKTMLENLGAALVDMLKKTHSEINVVSNTIR